MLNTNDKPRCPVTAKVRYTSDKQARHAAKDLGKITGKRNRAYRCEACSGWHLSSRPNDNERRVKPYRRQPARGERRTP